MSSQPESRRSDIQRLVDAGYHVEVVDAFLAVTGIPYVTSEMTVDFGTLFVQVDTLGPDPAPGVHHTARFAGSEPCDAQGKRLDSLICSVEEFGIAERVTASFQLSRIPSGGPQDAGPRTAYRDLYDQVTTYVSHLERHAIALDPDVRPIRVELGSGRPPSVFAFPDRASSRAGFADLNSRFLGLRLGIVGLGGTGSYILDLVAKTPVTEIHLWDGDIFEAHNAFRAPGGPSAEIVTAGYRKVEYFHQLYSAFRTGVVAHPEMVTSQNVNALAELDFVFLALDDGESRGVIAGALVDSEVPFIDVGLGLYRTRNRIAGLARVTVCVPEDGKAGLPHLPTGVPNEDDYETSLQVADLNALNATLAVIEWKKRAGVYLSQGGESQSLYQLRSNSIVSGGDLEATP
jgi:hypothetical protein